MRKKQLDVVCIKVMVKEKEGDESTEGTSVHDEKQWIENEALQGRESVINLTRKERDDK